MFEEIEQLFIIHGVVSKNKLYLFRKIALNQ